ncbi:response regulator [Acidaminococcus intestini]|nr:response regulator [Acidaminococcus intestini]
MLLDIMLPGESGIEILKKIRHKERTADLPVIMLTARTSEYDVVKGLTIGADDYVTKPFGILELISRIRAVLRRSHRVEKPSEMLVCGPVTLDP